MFEAQIEQYKELPLTTRLAAMAFVACLYPAYASYDRYTVHVEEMTTAEAEKSSALTRLNAAKRKKSELPIRLAEIDNLKQQINSITDVANKNMDIDELLRRTAEEGKSSEVDVELFRPEPAQELGSLVKYDQQSIGLTIQGKFPQATRFLDQLLNLGPLTFLNNIKYEYLLLQAPNNTKQSTESVDSLRKRSVVRVSAQLKVVKNFRL